MKYTMENDRQAVGRRGEDAACRYLQVLGHTVLERNWRGSHLEIDIITLKLDELHIVEVKTRRAPVMAEPEENVGKIKRDRLVRAANAFLHSQQKVQLPASLEIFFDVVSVVLDGEQETVEYFPQAFIPIYV